MTPEEKRWDSRLRRVYGITADDWLAQEKRQGGLCAVCHGPPGSARLAVEHNHYTGELRGLVCWKCNGAIAKLKDSADMARNVAVYLTYPPWRGPQNCLPGRSTTKLKTRQRLLRQRLRKQGGQNNDTK